MTCSGVCDRCMMPLPGCPGRTTSRTAMELRALHAEIKAHGFPEFILRASEYLLQASRRSGPIQRLLEGTLERREEYLEI